MLSMRKTPANYGWENLLLLFDAVNEAADRHTDDSGNCMIFGMLIGMSIGFALGQPLFNNMAAGMASGTCIGMAIGSFIDCIKNQ